MSIASRNKIVLQTPASWWGAKWREALPSGNGTIGAAVYGAVHKETILLTHEDLWHGAVTQEMPDVSSSLPEVRKNLLAGNFEAAETQLQNELLGKGYDPEISFPLPLGDLNILMPVSHGFTNYSRSLDMESGEVSVSWTDNGVNYSRSTFVSRPDNVVVTEIKAHNGPLAVDLSLGLHDVADRFNSHREELELPYQVNVGARDGGLLIYAATNPQDDTDFGAVAKVVPVGYEGVSPMMNVVDGALHITDASSVLIVTKLFVQAKRDTAWAEAKRNLDSLVMDYMTLLGPHLVEHKEIFSRVTLDLNTTAEEHEISNELLLLDAYKGEASTAMLEKMWSYGRYLLISSSRSGGKPCPLLGKWCGSYQGFWSFHMANENLEMIYWQALSGQMSETIIPVFDYYDNMMDDFRENAKKIYGCRGIYIPAVTTPGSGLLKTIRPHIIHWTGAAAWLARHYLDYYLYTGDMKFLINRAYPFMYEAALFYEDFFVIDEQGMYMSLPSNSPENTPGNYWDGKGMGSKMETTINATMDFALAKELLSNLLGIAKYADPSDEDVEKWKTMLARIPEYEINEDGAVKEWMHPFYEDNYHHRHMSHIYPVFPGDEVHKARDPELFEAFQIAIEKRLVIGIGEQTGWSLAHMACIYARMHNGEQALDCLNLLSRSCVKNNFYTTHNDWRDMGIGVEMKWAPFQIDANMGWSAAVQEMLLFSAAGEISILPALPKKWSKGSVKGLMACGGINVAIEWDIPANIQNVVLSSTYKDRDINLYFNNGKSCKLLLKKGEVHNISINEIPV